MVFQWQMKAGAQSQAQFEDDASDFKASSKNPLHSQLHKTKFCIYNLKGVCQYGDACAFAHTWTELKATPDLRKTKLCTKFVETGACDDPDCPFAHGGEELRSTNMFYKKTLCMWHEKGRCHNGDTCHFAHGAHELRVGNSPCGQSSSGQSTNLPSTTSGTATPEDDDSPSGFGMNAAPFFVHGGKGQSKGKGKSKTSRGYVAGKSQWVGSPSGGSDLAEPMKINQSRIATELGQTLTGNIAVGGSGNQDWNSYAGLASSTSDELVAEIARLQSVLAELSQDMPQNFDNDAMAAWGQSGMDQSMADEVAYMQGGWYTGMPWAQEWGNAGDAAWGAGVVETLKEASAQAPVRHQAGGGCGAADLEQWESVFKELSDQAIGA